VVGGGDPAIALVRLPAYHLHVDVGEERVRVLTPLPYALLQAFDSACVGPPVVGEASLNGPSSRKIAIPA
jgi:hypothetical protein